MLLKKFLKLDFVCHQCGTTYRPTIADVETIYDPCTDDPLDPPYIACENCFTGIAMPIRYTNKYGSTFTSELVSGKNGKQFWQLDVKPAPV